MSAPPVVTEPFPIHLNAGRYLLHDIATVSYLRRTYNLTGVLIGGLAQAPQQNVFSGLPAELMPEEARLLVDKGAAYIVDDPAQHTAAFLSNGLAPEEKAKFDALLNRSGLEAAQVVTKRAEERKDTALKRLEGNKVGNGDMENWNDMPEGMLAARPRGAGRTKSRQRGAERSVSGTTTPNVVPRIPSGPPSRAVTPVGTRDPDTPQGKLSDESHDEGAAASASEPNAVKGEPTADATAPSDADSVSLFSADVPAAPAVRASTALATYGITPATSYPPLTPAAPRQGAALLPPATASYTLFAHLHAKGYFLAPGLRFGCQYMAYPGDPLRYHSHFLVDGKGWDEDFELIELVGGGRLGTGVKKGFLLGGVEDASGEVRSFTVEWAGM